MTILPLTWADATGPTTWLPRFLYHRLAVPMLAATSRALRVARDRMIEARLLWWFRSPASAGTTSSLCCVLFGVAALPFLRPSYGSAPTWPGTSNSRRQVWGYGISLWYVGMGYRAPRIEPLMTDGMVGRVSLSATVLTVSHCGWKPSCSTCA